MTGIDLSDKHNEVRKLMRASIGRLIRHNGWDEDDVYQRVCLKILTANKTKPFDPSRSSFSTYVWKVCKSVALHLYEAEENRERYLPVEDDPDDKPLKDSSVPDVTDLLSAHRFLDGLPSECGDVLRARLDGLSWDETQETCGLTRHALEGHKGALKAAFKAFHADHPRLPRLHPPTHHTDHPQRSYTD